MVFLKPHSVVVALTISLLSDFPHTACFSLDIGLESPDQGLRQLEMNTFEFGNIKRRCAVLYHSSEKRSYEQTIPCYFSDHDQSFVAFMEKLRVTGRL